MIDTFALANWMDEKGLGRGPLQSVRALRGGTQNTVVAFARSGERYVLRHPPRGRDDGCRMVARERQVLAALEGTDVPHPHLIASCLDSSVIGAPFNLMSEVDGANPTTDLPLAYRRSSAWRRVLGEAIVEAASAIGAVDHNAVGLSDFGHSDDFLERQVTRWRRQLNSYASLANYVCKLDGVETIGDWLEANRPRTWTPGLLHGDFHVANILCTRDAPAVAAVIDWELATIGDPLLDLGWLLVTWPREGSPVSATIEPSDGLPSQRDLVERYAERSARDLSALVWYEVLAAYKLAILLEGTHARAGAGRASPIVGNRLHRSAVELLAYARRRSA